MVCRVFIGLPEVSAICLNRHRFAHFSHVGGLLPGVDVPVVEMVHQEGRAHYPSNPFPFLSHLRTRIGTGATFGRSLRWPVNIQCIWQRMSHWHPMLMVSQVIVVISS